MKERLGVKQTSNTIKYLSDGLEKLPLVNWTIKGQRRWKPFSIIPRESISANSINVDKDTLVRWGRMKDGKVDLTFANNQSVFQGNRPLGILNIISSEESDLKDKGYSDNLKLNNRNKSDFMILLIFFCDQNPLRKTNEQFILSLNIKFRVMVGKLRIDSLQSNEKEELENILSKCSSKNRHLNNQLLVTLLLFFKYALRYQANLAFCGFWFYLLYLCFLGSMGRRWAYKS